MRRNLKNGKISLWKKLSKNPQKILECRFRRADSKNIAYLRSQSNILDILGPKLDFLKELKNCHISIGDSRKMVRIIEEMMANLTSGSQNILQENVFSSVSNMVENGSKFEEI